MSGFDFLSQPFLPRPRVTPEDAAAIARDRFDVGGDITELGSQQDRNFLIQDTGDPARDDGDPARDGHRTRYVLKVANPAFSVAELAAQDAAMAHLARRGMQVPRAVQGRDGEPIQSVTLHGQQLHVRLLTYVEGAPMTGAGALTPAQVSALGDAAGRIAHGLGAFTHPGTERSIQWDLRIAADVVNRLVEHVEDPDRRQALRAAVEQAGATLARVGDTLRLQTIHGDVTDDNVVATRADPVDESAPLGVIDFGDVSQGWLVAELATTCASVLHHHPGRPLVVLDAVAAFAARVPLADAELTALWPLVVLRTAVLVVSGEQQVSLDGDNDYADANRRHEWVAFETATGADADQMESLIRWRVAQSGSAQSGSAQSGSAQAAQAVQVTPSGRHPLVAGLSPSALLDLSVTSAALDEGVWLDPLTESRIAGSTHARHGAAVTRHGEYRLTRAVPESAHEVATLALGVEVYLSPGTPLVAPVDGTLRKAPDGADGADGGLGWVLSTQGYDVWLGGVDRPGSGQVAVAAGEVLGTVAAPGDGAAPGRLTVQVCRARGVRPPMFVCPSDAHPWLQVCPDPSGLLGLSVAAPEAGTEELLARRDASFARVQEHYFEHPPQIERGWRHHLVDVRAQTYVDMVNNVTAVGHGHPRLVEAVSRQWALLNTNSRFHYAEVVRFTERLAALAPDPLDTVFLVNSGTEAVDLALRIARAVTGRPTVLAVREAYHGWSIGADAVSSSIADNPGALDTRPDWVHLVEAPHTYRGRYRGPDSAPRYLGDLAADLRMLEQQGRGIAAFIAEPVFGNAGGVLLPDGYLKGVYAQVRAKGGLCIADEVQVGYGRLGDWFWGSAQQGVVPDIITVAKAMGNGHPLGAVITRRDVAERFSSEGSLFSSAGGSPVSCRVGLTVLDIMEDEDLQDNARTVGAHLLQRLEDLAKRFDLIGAVHGLGLYLGVELVLDPTTLAPATAQAAAVCDALLRQGCIVQPTGDHKNVLKIKPPLCLSIESADFFADALERVLASLDG